MGFILPDIIRCGKGLHHVAGTAHRLQTRAADQVAKGFAAVALDIRPGFGQTEFKGIPAGVGVGCKILFERGFLSSDLVQSDFHWGVSWDANLFV